ncbi:MAG: hypothetical protein Q8M07_29800 [Prosthecobacter sp.]|nr:hypothetical protein [Prosthecobacter sp.]
MSSHASASKSPASFLQVAREDASEVAEAVFGKVFRVDWSELGFAILVLPETTDSKALRQFMVALKQGLSACYAARWGEPLEYLSLGRFDQQNTTKLHLDGAPEVSLLMLGYEPTAVRSELQIADYSRCAFDLGLTPAEFLQHHNPMFIAGQELLEPYTSRLTDWHEESPRIVLINNSHTAPGSPRHTAGVMHGASILRPDPNASRIINSTMIAPASCVLEDASAKEAEFLHTDAISGLL